MAKTKGGVMTVINIHPDSCIKRFIETEVYEIMESTQVGISAINSSTQFVISGAESDIYKMECSLRPRVKSMQRLSGVSCAFHSPLMATASNEFRLKARELLCTIRVDPDRPVISNYTAKEHTQKDLLDSLALQIIGTVRWHGTIARIHELGCTGILPLGPGAILKNLLNRDPSVKLPLLS